MPKQGDIDYLKNIGDAGVRHATDKPFSGGEFAKHLIDLGVIAGLLPPPPARILDLGCGTGWTSCFLARRGYQVVGQDISADMIDQAQLNRTRYEVGENLSFVVCDYEEMRFVEEFDAALFFDSLHHSVDEEAALRMVYRALRPNGVCITSEPGDGHAKSPHARQAMERYQVTERDMPARRIRKAARKAGFRDFRTFPHLSQWADLVYHQPAAGAKAPLLKGMARSLIRRMAGWVVAGPAWIWVRRHDGGVVLMRKRPG
jgi:ubiquinone/menaquinone biosynthesis C-methylase UbiE